MSDRRAPLVVLPGALGPIEDADSFASMLEEQRQLVRIHYAADDTLDRLVSRIASAASAMTHKPFDLLGQSYGGWIAQCFAARFPDNVRRLILSHSFVVAPGDAWRFVVGRQLLRAMPAPLFDWLLAKRLDVALKPLKRLNRPLFDQLAHQFSISSNTKHRRTILLAQQRVLAKSCRVDASATAAPDMPVLILESDRDPIVPLRAQKALKARYPRAEVHCFSGTGHISALARPREYADAIDCFLS